MTRAWIHDVRMAQFVHIMGPRESQDLRSPSPIMAPDLLQYTDKTILFCFGCSEVNSIWLITSELANQRAQKVPFTCEVYTNLGYYIYVICRLGGPYSEKL